MLFTSDNILQLHSSNSSVLRFKLKSSTIKILCYEGVQNSPIKIYSWETLGLNPRIGIKFFCFFFPNSVWGQISKIICGHRVNQAPLWRKLAWQRHVQYSGEPWLTPGSSWEMAGITDSSSSLGSCPVQSQSPNNTPAQQYRWNSFKHMSLMQKAAELLHSNISFPHPVPFYKKEPDLFASFCHMRFFRGKKKRKKRKRICPSKWAHHSKEKYISLISLPLYLRLEREKKKNQVLNVESYFWYYFFLIHIYD